MNQIITEKNKPTSLRENLIFYPENEILFGFHKKSPLYLLIKILVRKPLIIVHYVYISVIDQVGTYFRYT